MTASTATDRGAAALAVLTNAQLFGYIGSWAGGWPALVVQRWREIKVPLRPAPLTVIANDFMWALVWRRDRRTLELTRQISTPRFRIGDVSKAIETGDPETVRLALEFSTPAHDKQREKYWALAIAKFPGHTGVLDELAKFEPVVESDLRHWLVPFRNRERSDQWGHMSSSTLEFNVAQIDSAVLAEWLINRLGPVCLPRGLICNVALRGNLELVRLLDTVVNQELEPDIFYNVYCLAQDDRETKHTDYMGILVFLLEHREEYHTRELERACFDAGDHKTLALIQRTRSLRFLANVNIDSAASRGYLESIKLVATTTRVTCTTDAMDGAARNGHLDTVIFLHDTAVGCTSAAMDDAAANGHLEIVQFLHRNRHEGCTSRAMEDAAVHGHLDIVRFLSENRNEGFTMDGMDKVARSCYRGAPDLQYANRHVSFSSSRRGLSRTEKSRFKNVRSTLIYLLEHHDMEINHSYLSEDAQRFQQTHYERVEFDALRFQDLEVLTIIQKKRGLHYLQDIDIDGIAGDGNLELIRFLVQHVSVSCTVSAMDAAAAKGHLDVVKYLHETRDEGCTTAAMDMAASGNHWEVVAFLDENRSEGCSSVLLNAAVRSGRLDLVERYSKRFPRVSLGAAAFVAGVYGHTTIQEFLQHATSS